MRFYAILLTFLIGLGLVGCRERPVAPPVDDNVAPTEIPDTTEPHPILAQMVSTYQAAISYSDRATVQIIGKMSQPDTEPAPWNCIVVFQKPNRLRLEIDEGMFVSDGEDCYAQIRPLPDQVLHRPTPEYWTLETLFQDVHLDHAMELGLPPSVLRFPPQLVLLFANNPLNTFCPKGAAVEWLKQQPIGPVPCDVIQISHSDGNRILWISQENSALLRLEYQPVGLPVPEGYESIEAIRIEMTDARFDWNFDPDPFQMLQPQNAVQVAEFQSDASGLPTREEHRHMLNLMADNDTYRLIDQQIESVIASEQSLPPTAAPKTFTLSQIWSLPLVGSDAVTLLSGESPQLLIPYEGNVVEAVDMQGNSLKKNTLKVLEDSIITGIQVSSSLYGTRRIGIITVDSKFYLFDESFTPLVTYNEESDKQEIIRDFRFVQYQGEELLLLGVQNDSEQENVSANGVIRAVDVRGAKRWEYPFEGELNQIVSAMIEDQPCVLVSRTLAQQDSILVLSPEGAASEPINMALGRHVIWFHVMDSTIYTLVLSTDGYVRFIAMDMNGSGHWSRRFEPAGEYEVDPIYISKEKKWFVSSPSGEIFVFDLVGNQDSFSLDVVPTGLFGVENKGKTLLIVTDGETVSAWEVGER